MGPLAILLLLSRWLLYANGFSARELTFASFASVKTKERKNATAPVVDSYLLRILSLNKQQKQRVAIAADADNPSPLAESFRTILNNVPEKQAIAAAISVETLAVDRHTKRQWRRFLKDRQAWLDSSNNSTTPVPLPSSGAAAVASPPAPGMVFSVDDDLKNAERVMDKMVEYGLSGRDIAEIMIHTPQVAFLEPTTALTANLDRVLHGLLMGRSQPHHLGMRKFDARRILREAPGLLTGSGAKAAESMVELMISLGVSKTSLLRDRKSLTILLRRQPAAVFRLVAFLSSDAVRMPLSSIGPLLRRSVCQPLLDAVASHEEPPDALTRQLQRAVVSDLYSRMSRTADTLRYELGAGDLTNVIASYPPVLLIDAAKLSLMSNYLMNDLGIFKDDLPRILRLYPVLLRMDLEQVQNVISYFLSLDVPEDRLGVIIRSFPSLLTMDIEHDMEPVVSFLRDEVGINNVGRFIARLPPVLGYSVTHDLRPKYVFLSSVVADPLFEVSKFPAYFSYPLERAVLRFAYLRQKRKLLVPLDEVLRFGDYDFCHQVAGDKDVRAYKEFVNKRKDLVQKAITEKIRSPTTRGENDAEEDAT